MTPPTHVDRLTAVVGRLLRISWSTVGRSTAVSQPTVSKKFVVAHVLLESVGYLVVL